VTQRAGVVEPPLLDPAAPAGAATSPGGRRLRRGRSATSLTPASGLGLGVALLWFSLLVLIPLTAVLVQASEGGWSAYWDAIRSPQTLASLRLTVGHAILVTAVNVFMGTAIAWVLVRDHFPGKQVLEVVIDIPFALPTIVAGLVLLSLYGPSSPLGVNWANTPVAVFLAFLFVTLPFIVRTVQPVLLEIEPEVEEAAASLGATQFTIFRRVILPSLTPAIASGAALSFCRAISEYGSLVLLSGNLPYSTEVASVRILSYIEGDKLTEAAAVASILLVVALVVIVILDVISRRVTRYG
jgi:sulfate transport system permease protein